MKKHMCRIFKDLLMVMLIFSLCMQTIPTSQALAADSSQKDAFKAELIQMFKTGDTTTHDISMYSLTYSEMNSIFTSVTKNECMIEYNCGSFIVTSTTRDSNDLLLTFRLANLDSDYLARLGRMKANIDAALAGISDKMSDLEKALYLHDYLLSICYYKSSSGLLCHSAGGILGNGEGVCQGYRLAYELLLTLAGVKATYLTSTKMNHSWNAVYLDGQYYQVDPTWDDTRATNGISHKFFLRTDEEFATAASPHYGWSNSYENIVCTSTKYSNWFVHDVESRMYYCDGFWYYESGNSILRAKIDGSEMSTVIAGDDTTGKYKIISVENDTLTYKDNTKRYTYSLTPATPEVVPDVTPDTPILVPDSSTSTPSVTPDTNEAVGDVYNMTDKNNWRYGYYNYYDGQYGEYSARICLNDYVDAFSETPLTVKISEENFRILVRELDVNGKFIKSVTLKDGDTYIPSANASTLGISVYCVVWTTLNYEKYMQKFDNGFEATLYGAKETPEDAAEDITQK